tara:strand:+ start:702 stop:2192 length:1491 start_codon:yes stop_codon:yes gene_type:complete
MSKSKLKLKFFKNINKSINSLLEKNLNKLKFDNLAKLFKNNTIILTFVALFILFISYLVLPTFYKQEEISKELKKELIKKYGLNFEFSNNLKYNFFPKPHFKSIQASILSNRDEISKIHKIKIYVSSKNFFSSKNLKIKKVILERANFNIDKNNYNFFIDILKNNFSKSTLNIKKSNIFFRNNKDEVLFLNKIIKMKYVYDDKELKNILLINNEIFNIPYSLEVYNDNQDKILYTKLFLNTFGLKAENLHNYRNKLNEGILKLNLNKIKSILTYKTNKKFFKFDYRNKSDNLNFKYEGEFNFKPFYSILKGNTDELNLSHFISQNAIISELLKTEILNNKNIEFELLVNGKTIKNNENFKNIILSSKIKEGLIDLDKTKFEWSKRAKFEFKDSLVFVKNGELILDGNLQIKIKDVNEIYKFFVTPKNYRKKINKIDLNFTYNFEQNSADLKDIKIDNKFNNNVNIILNNIILKRDNLQNKIYLKNLFNKALKSYAG